MKLQDKQEKMKLICTFYTEIVRDSHNSILTFFFCRGIHFFTYFAFFALIYTESVIETVFLIKITARINHVRFLLLEKISDILYFKLRQGIVS